MKITIASGKGGVGKSMLSSALAMFFAEKNKVVACDCDVDTPNLAIWLNEINNWEKTLPVATSAKPEIDYMKCNGCGLCVKNCRFAALNLERGKPRLNPFFCEGCGACEVICPQKAIRLKAVQNGQINIKKTKYNFYLVSGQLFPGETGSGKIVAEIKKETKKIMNKSFFAKASEDTMVIIDSTPGTGCPVIASLQGSDFAVLVTEPTLSGFSDVKRVLKVVNHFEIPWALVINKWDINPRVTSEIKKWAGRKFLGKISFDKKIFKAIANLQPILETELEVKKEIKRIFDRLEILVKKFK